jgi:hypothetical protein
MNRLLRSGLGVGAVGLVAAVVAGAAIGFGGGSAGTRHERPETQASVLSR